MKGGDKKIRRFEDIVAWQKARELVKINNTADGMVRPIRNFWIWESNRIILGMR